MTEKLKEKYNLMPVQVKASFWFLVCSFFQKGISFITTPIFTRILTTGEYGEYNVFNSWLQIITPIVSLNLSSGVYAQGIVKFEDERDQFTSSLQGLGLTLILAWTIVYLSFHTFFNNIFSLTIVQMICMFMMIWANGSFNFWSMNQRVDFKYNKLVVMTIAASIAQPLLSIILIKQSIDKVTARILGMTIVQLSMYSWTFLSQIQKGRRFFYKKFWSYALKFNIPLLPHYLSLTILSSSDRIMIKKMVGSSEAGIYSLAYSVAMIMSLFNTALLQTVEPWIYKKLKASKAKDIAMVAYPTFTFIGAVNIFLIVLAPEVITFFAPKQYYDAIWVIPSVALSVYFTYIYCFFATFEFYYEKTKYIASATIGGAVLNILLNYIFIEQYGYLAAGYTTLVSYIMFAVLHYIFMRKICREFMNNVQPYRLKTVLMISICTTLLGFGMMLTYPFPAVRYTIIGITIILAIIKRETIKEITLNLLNMRKNK